MPERNLNFDEVINRRHTDSLKYDFALQRGKPRDVTPFWVADMDFRTSSYIEDALVERSHHAIFGYSESAKDYEEAVHGWMKKQHGWEIEGKWLIKTPGVVFALAMAVKAYTRPGDCVLIQQPVYYPFQEVITDNGRKPVSNDLVLGADGRYHIDFDDFESKIIHRGIRLFLLCSPHNPAGRVWSREELERMGDICLKHGVIIVSDEIHEDFVFEGRHYVLAGLKEAYAEISVICTSPSKTFNIAGMMISNILIPNPKLRSRFRHEVDAAGISQLGAMGLVACEAAYRHGETWYLALMEYLKGNRTMIADYVECRLPGIRMIPLEGTYLAWLDFRGTGLTDDEIEDRMLNQAGLWLDGGRMFGSAGEGFQRINIACPRTVLQDALERIRHAFVI